MVLLSNMATRIGVDDIGLHLLDSSLPLAKLSPLVSHKETNQPKLEVFAEGEKEFFVKAVDAQITFETGADGRATTAVLHQNGRDQKASRVVK